MVIISMWKRRCEKTEIKKNNILDTDKGYLLVYTLSVLVMFGCITAIFLWYGKGYVYAYDSYTQVYSGIYYFKNWIYDIWTHFRETGQWIIPQWDLKIGFGEPLISIILFNPATFVSIFFPIEHLEWYFIFLNFTRLWLCGFAFFLYAKCFVQDRYSILLASFIYTFCGARMMRIGDNSIISVIAIAIPFMCLGIEKILEENKKGYFFLGTLVCLIGFPYSILIVAIPVAGYACIRYYYVVQDKSIKNFLGKVWQVICAGIGALLIAAYQFVPYICNALQSARTEGGKIGNIFYYDIKYYFQAIRDIISITYYDDAWKIGMTSIGVIAILYLIAKRKTRGDKQFIFCMLLGLFVLLVPIADLAVNLFMGANGRFQYIYVFIIAMVIAMGCEQFVHGKIKRELPFITLGSIAYAALYVISTIALDEKLGASIVFLLINVLLLNLYVKNKKVIKNGKLVAFSLVFGEILLMGMGTFTGVGNSKLQFYADYKLEDERQNSSVVMLENVKHDNARVDVIYDSVDEMQRNKNYGLRSNCNGVNSYYSFVKSGVVDYIKSTGIVTGFSSFNILDMNQRTVSNTLAGVKYITATEEGKKQIPYGYKEIDKNKREGKAQYDYLFENENAVPLAYTYDQYISRKKYDSYLPYEREQLMLDSVVLDDETAVSVKESDTKPDTIVNTNFDEIKQILKHNPNIKVYKDKIIVYEDNTECNIQAEKLKKQEVYVYLEGAKYETLQGETGSNTLNTHITVTTKNRTSDLQLFVGKHEYYQGAVDGVLNLGISNTDKKEMAIRFTKAGTYYFKNIQVASASMKGYTKKVQKLKEDKIEGFKIAGSDVSLNVNVDKNKVLCIAIPYAQGWSVKVNGKDAKLLNCNLMYMGVELEAGNNQVELHYEMPGFKLGVLCSGIFGCVFLLYIILLGIRKVKNRKNVVCA